MTAISGSAAAITGAANGIGRALALELAARGCDLALADCDKGGLADVAAELAETGRKVTTYYVDVSDPAQIEAFAAASTSAHPSLNILINNAGVALLGQFGEVEQAEFEWLMNINFWGVVYGTRAFLPQLSSQPAAHIVNMSSIFGIVAPPEQTAYCASKFAVRGFSEALRHELKLAVSPVKLSVVHPGGTATNIVRNIRTGVAATDNDRHEEIVEFFDTKFAKTTARAAAASIIAGIEKNATRILVGRDARLLDWMQRIFPGTYLRVLKRGLPARWVGK